ncbi:MAG: hypothetical protein AAGF96_18945 [Bacteroidota bacterium]
MSSRNIYRKWYDYNQDNECFLKIRPDGTVLEIQFTREPIYGEKVVVFNTYPTNPLDPLVFKKHKEVCSKAEWQKAVKRVVKRMHS